MRRFFVKNILFIIAVNVLVKPIWVFFIDRTVQNTVGHEAYGSYQPLLNFCIIFQIILDFGLTNYNSRTISQNPDKLKNMFPAMLSARFVLMMVYAAIVLAAGWLIGYRGNMLLLLVGVLMIQSLNMLLQFIRSNVSALHRFKVDGLLSVSDRFLMIIVCGFLLYYPATAHKFKIQWFVEAQIACYFTACVIAFFVLRHIHPLKLRFSFHVPTVYGIIKESFPYALLIFLMSIYNRSDSTIIERLAGKEQAGIYAASYRLLDVSNMFGLMFATMLLPLFGRMIAKKQDVTSIVRLCVDMLLPLGFMLAVAASFFGNPIMHMLYKDVSSYDGHIFAWLMASFPAWCMMYVYSTLLTANGSMKTLNKIAFAGVIINLSLNFYLIPHHQALGAAVTTFITQTSLAIAFMLAAGKLFRLPKNFKWILSHAGFLGLLIAVAYGATKVSIPWKLQLVSYGTVCIVLMFVFRFISLKSIKMLLTKE